GQMERIWRGVVANQVKTELHCFEAIINKNIHEDVCEMVQCLLDTPAVTDHAQYAIRAYHAIHGESANQRTEALASGLQRIASTAANGTLSAHVREVRLVKDMLAPVTAPA